MKKNLITLATLLFLSSTISFAQAKQYRFNCKHYGDHPTWNYFAEVNKWKRGDTIYYEKKSFTKNEIKNIDQPSQFLKIKFYLMPNGLPAISEELIINGMGLFYSMKRTSDSVLVEQRGKRIALPAPKLPFFGSVESIELYLSTLALNRNFQQDILVDLSEDEKTPRPFQIKVLSEISLLNPDKKLRACYEVAIFSLDSSNVGDAKLYIDKENSEVFKKEYLVIEKSVPTGGRKSQAVEYAIDLNYEIDLSKLKSPTAEEYVEAVFNTANKEKNAADAIAFIDKALVNGATHSLIESKISILNYLNKKDEAAKFAIQSVKSFNLNTEEMFFIGRYFSRAGDLQTAQTIYEYNATTNPTSFLPLVGLARVWSAKGDLPKAKEYLKKTLPLKQRDAQRQLALENIERLEKGEKMN